MEKHSTRKSIIYEKYNIGKQYNIRNINNNQHLILEKRQFTLRLNEFLNSIRTSAQHRGQAATVERERE